MVSTSPTPQTRLAPRIAARLATRFAVLTLACGGPLTGGGCTCNDSAETDKKGAVREIIGDSVRHQSAMLAILEAHRDDRAHAVELLDRYQQENDESLERIAHQRALIESELGAMAEAMKTYGPALGQNLERRQRLETDRPELMADPRVRAALARLDAL